MPLRTSVTEDFVHAFFRIAVITGTLVSMTIAQANAADMLALSGVARAYGFTYASQSTQRAVVLTRPGLSLLIRAGDPRYQVNDEVWYLTSPVFRNNQIFVDAAFERIVADLAAAHPWPAPAAPMLASVSGDPAAAPPKLTVSATYVDGSEAIDVSGTGPANFPVSVVLKGRMSRDLPIVTLTHAIVFADASGRYEVVLPAGSIVLQNTTFFATASGRGMEPVTAHVDIQKPNPGLHSPNDGLPKA
jgi:hypothetical protein